MLTYRITLLCLLVAIACCCGTSAFAASKKKPVKVFLDDKGNTPQGMWINGYGGGHAAKKKDKKDRPFVEAELKSFKERMVWNFSKHMPIAATEFKEHTKLVFVVTISAKAAYAGTLSLGWMDGNDVASRTELRVDLKEGKEQTLEFPLPDPGTATLTGFSIGCSNTISFSLTSAEVITAKKKKGKR